MPSIRDVARYAEVSPATVSMVANGREGVARDTRRRVEMAIRKLGYRSKRPGRSNNGRKSGATYNVGLIFPVATEHYRSGRIPLYDHWIRGARRVLAAHGDHPTVFTGPRLDEEDALFRSLLEAGELDGLIFAGVSFEYFAVRWAVESNLPVVAINRRSGHGEFSYVGCDNYRGGRLAIEHLLSLGHRRIALVRPPQRPTFVDDRLAGARDALRREQIEPAGELVFRRDVDVSVGAAEVIEQARAEHVTAMFAVNDPLASGLTTGLEAADITVPEQMSVIGFDHIGQDLTESGKQLSTIGTNHQQIGEASADVLRSLMNHWPRVRAISRCFDVYLVEGDTTGPAPQ